MSAKGDSSAAAQAAGKAPQASSKDPLTLTLISRSGEEKQVQVNRSPFRIGRLPECDLSLHESRISRNHAQILAEDGVYFVEDCGSRHGVWVNGEKTARHRLQPGDRVTFGVEDSYELVVAAPSYSAPLIEKVASLASSEGAGNLARLSAVLEVARALQSSLSVEHVLTAAVDAALVVTGAERGFLMLSREDGTLGVEVARDRLGKTLDADELRVPRAVIQRSLTGRGELLSMSFDPSAERGTSRDACETVVGLELRGAVCVPLVRIRIGQQQETSLLSPGDDTLGVLYMDSKTAAADLSSGKRELLQTLAIEISTVLENARLLEEQRKKHQLEQELKIARDIQQSMLPAKLPSEGWLLAAGSSEACLQVGGDYFDVMPLSPDHWGAVLADVSGKGVSAALLTSLIQGAFFSTLEVEASLADTFSRVNRYLCERSRHAKFATVFHCLVRRDGFTRWVSAGHCPAILVRASGRTELLKPESCPIGLFPETSFPQREFRLEAGDKLVIYSDGVSEAENWSREQFGEERLEEIVRHHRAQSAPVMFETLRERIKAFTAGAPQNDDITLLVLGYEG